MRLAEQGKVDLAAPARRYLPDLKLADETAASVTVRQLLNHSAGWMGDDYMGASLSALEGLGRTKGYRLVGCNVAGVNAFFVREDLAGDLFAAPASAEALFQPPRYDLIYAYRGGHGASSLSIVQGASEAAGLGIDIATVGATFTPDMP